MYVILYFDPHIFVLDWWLTPSQISLNRILWLIDHCPHHPMEWNRLLLWISQMSFVYAGKDRYTKTLSKYKMAYVRPNAHIKTKNPQHSIALHLIMSRSRPPFFRQNVAARHPTHCWNAESSIVGSQVAKHEGTNNREQEVDHRPNLPTGSLHYKTKQHSYAYIYS